MWSKLCQQSRHSRFSHNSVINKSITDIYPEELSQFYVFNYTFQDKADESNINFYDSNLKSIEHVLHLGIPAEIYYQRVLIILLTSN